MKLSCSSPMVPGDTLTEKARFLRSCGYDAIAVFMERSEFTDEVFAELLELKEKTGVFPCEFVFSDPYYGRLMDGDPQARDKALRLYSDAAAVCARLGAVTELEFQYGAQNPLPLFTPYRKMNARQEADFLETYGAVAAVAAGSGAAVLIEPINRYESPYLNCVRDCVELLGKLNRPNTGLLLDFFHMCIEERDLVGSIRAAGSLIRHVHIADSNRLLPGYGSIDWGACLSALRETGYDGFLNLECAVCGDPYKTLPETAVFLKGLSGIRR